MRTIVGLHFPISSLAEKFFNILFFTSSNAPVHTNTQKCTQRERQNHRRHFPISSLAEKFSNILSLSPAITHQHTASKIHKQTDKKQRILPTP